eukprot:6213716-Pleurochrysis_carterae.AAC.3
MVLSLGEGPIILFQDTGAYKLRFFFAAQPQAAPVFNSQSSWQSRLAHASAARISSLPSMSADVNHIYNPKAQQCEACLKGRGKHAAHPPPNQFRPADLRRVSTASLAHFPKRSRWTSSVYFMRTKAQAPELVKRFNRRHGALLETHQPAQGQWRRWRAQHFYLSIHSTAERAL